MSGDHMINPKYFWNWVYCCSAAKSSEPMDCSTPGFPVPHHLPKFAQVYVHCIDDTIQSGTMMIPWNPVYTVVIKSTAIQIRCTTLPEPRDMLLLSCILWLPKFFFFFFMFSSYVPTTLSGTEKVKWKLKLFSRVQLFGTPWTIKSMEFSRLEYWSGWPFPSPDLPNPGIEPRSPTLQMDTS